MIYHLKFIIFPKVIKSYFLFTFKHIVDSDDNVNYENENTGKINENNEDIVTHKYPLHFNYLKYIFKYLD